jgi:carbamoyltransferase
MIIVGLKLTHDGAVAVLDGDHLVVSTEVEKRHNQPRFSALDDLGLVDQVLAEHGIAPGSVDAFAVDGWGPAVNTRRDGRALSLRVAPYAEDGLGDDSLAGYWFDGLEVGGRSRRYRSFRHTTGHILAAYCTSPFAPAGEPSFVLVWDGSVQPRLYHVDQRAPGWPQVTNLGPVFGMLGSAYATFATYFPPFRRADLGNPPDWKTYHQLSLPGKVMAYTALGSVRDDLCQVLDQIYAEELTISFEFAHTLARSFLRRTSQLSYSPADAMASFQHWLGHRLVQGLTAVSRAHGGHTSNLCLSGGCALNIKWNTAIRRSGAFGAVFVPPFPNDSGSAVGAACGVLAGTGQAALNWTVYSGPSLTPGAPCDTGTAARYEYEARPCTVASLAALLHAEGEPVVVLHGKAELGPRALGNRSILAPATDPAMKDRLNVLKDREGYRPVSPVCLEERAADIFDPGGPDPYMLFEHQVRSHWRQRIPAVLHLDGSARLQTVSRRQNAMLATLLAEYGRHSGVPVLCNTSANLSGSGFFPDVESALRWGRCKYVWSDGTLWCRSVTAPAVQSPAGASSPAAGASSPAAALLPDGPRRGPDRRSGSRLCGRKTTNAGIALAAAHSARVSRIPR